MDKEVVLTIIQVKDIIEEFEAFCNLEIEQLPGFFSDNLLELKKLSSQLRGWFEIGFCAKEIQEAVCKMNWEVFCDEDCLIQGSTDEEKRALYYVVKNLGIIARADERQPTEAQSETKSLDELLSFVPTEHLEAAKHAFERLLQDGTIKRIGNKFEWLKKPTNGLIWYFTHEANNKWKLFSENDRFIWKPFADLFGVKVVRLTEWQSKYNRGIYNKPDGYKYIDDLFK